MTAMPIEFGHDDVTGRILLPTDGAPFDGKPYLVRFSSGWCTAVWIPHETHHTPDGIEHEGFFWSCMDDDFQKEHDEAKEWAPLPKLNSGREKWLNGWRRGGDQVQVGTAICCAGCGYLYGITCVVFDGTEPELSPDWPFEEETCPLHPLVLEKYKQPPEPEDKLLKRMLALREAEKGKP